MGTVVSTGFKVGVRCPKSLQGADPLPPSELLSSEHSAACSPRLSPDGQRLLYLEGDLGGPHRQCLRLCMVRETLWTVGTAASPMCTWPGMLWHLAVSGQGRGWSQPVIFGSVSPTANCPQINWQTRQAVTVLDVVHEPTEGEPGMVGSAKNCQEAKTSPCQVPMAQPHHCPALFSAFAGVYGEALPPRCWAADSRRVVLGTAQRSRKVSPGPGEQGM